MSDDKTFEQREEERISRALQKKSGPQTIDEIRKKRELEQKRKIEQEKKKQEQEEAKKKEAELQRQKLENLRIQKEAEERALKEKEKEQEIARQKEREQQAKREQQQQQQQQQVPQHSQNDADDEDAAKEAARMSKMFGITPTKLSNAVPEPQKTVLDVLIQKDLQQDNNSRSVDKPEPLVEKESKDWRDQQPDHLHEATIKNFAEDEDLESKEAARMAKMFGLSPQRLTTESPKNQKARSSSKTSNSSVDEDDAVAAKEAERMAKMMGGNAKNYDPKEEVKEKERKKFEQSLQGISDPKELSKAFLNDPEMMAHLKDVKGVIAVNTLKGVDIPGGHKF